MSDLRKILAHLREPLAWGAGLYVLTLPLMFFREGVTAQCIPAEFLCDRVLSAAWSVDIGDRWGVVVVPLIGLAAPVLAFWSADIFQRGRTARSRWAMIGPLLGLLGAAVLHMFTPVTIFTDVAQSDWVAVRVANAPFMLMLGCVAAAGVGALMLGVALIVWLARRFGAAAPATT